MNLVLFGPPGAGKGTQSSLLIDRKRYFQLSTGDLFRAAIKGQTELGKLAKSYMDAGKLVPDSLTLDLVGLELDKIAGKKFILDGFPRNVQQANALEDLLLKKKLSIGKAIFLEVPREKLIDRLTGRRVCKSCGSVFHVRTMPPKRDGICDRCQGELYQRNDDKEEVIRTRLLTYEESTAPLKEYYLSKGRISLVDGDRNTEEVYKDIERLIG